jgi:hypothetical protein
VRIDFCDDERAAAGRQKGMHTGDGRRQEEHTSSNGTSCGCPCINLIF